MACFITMHNPPGIKYFNSILGVIIMVTAMTPKLDGHLAQLFYFHPAKFQCHKYHNLEAMNFPLDPLFQKFIK